MHFASMSLGIFDFLIDWLTSFLMWIVEWTLGLVMDIIGVLLYDLASSILYLVDIIQQMFRKLCGMDTIWINGKPANYVDPVITVLTDKSVLEILLALTIVAFAMVIIASIIQIIRTEFSTEGSKNTKGQIFGTALKSILLFVLVPVTCVGGLILSNALLRSIDKATSGATQSTMGAQIAVSALASAKKSSWSESVEKNFLTVDDDGNLMSGYNYRKTDDVKKYYDLGECNFFILIGSAVIALFVLFTASFGLVMRIYKIAVLFVISPPLVGLMPLYDTAYKEWRRAFIGQVLGAYGSVVTLNLMFQLMPLVNNIDLFAPGSYGNDVGHLLFTLTALFLMKDLPGIISKFIAAEDAGAAGMGAAKAVGGAALKVGMAATGGAAALAMKGMGAAAGGAAKLAQKGGHGKTSKVFGAISNSIGGAGNKLGQKAKGNMASVANKTLGAVTFGAMKGVFDEEKDYGKAQETKAKKQEATAKAMKAGTAGVGAYIPGMLKKAGYAGRYIASAAQSKKENARFTEQMQGIANERQAIKDDKTMSKGQKLQAYKRLKGQEREAITAHAGIVENIEDKRDAIGAGIRSFATGGATTIANLNADRVETKAMGAITSAAFAQLGGYLRAGNSLGAAQGIDQMVRALDSIADKTEEQKELLMKLTSMKTQVDSAAGNKSALASMANSETFKEIGRDVDKVSQIANNTYQVSSNVNVNASLGNIQQQVDEATKKAMQKVEQNQEAMKNALKEQGKEIQEILSKSKKK